MTNEDRVAIATYLKSLPASHSGTPEKPEPAQMFEGQAIFVARCQACHQPPGQPDQPGPGPLPDYPKLGGDTLILGRDATTVARIILQGAESAVTPNAKNTYSMPAFATLTNDEIAAVASYIRNSWGNHAGAVTPHEIKALRAELQ